MWSLVNHTPFAADVGAYRTHDARSWWGLWLKASFDLRDAQPPLFRAAQVPLHRGPVMAEDGHIAQDADLTPPRPMIDLHVSGHAQQPDPATADGPATVALALGNWRKALDIHPPLRWGLTGRARVDHQVRPIRIPLAGLHAYGGDGHDSNPPGRGYLPPDAADKTPAPPPVVYRAGDALPRRGKARGPRRSGPAVPCLAGARGPGRHL